MKKDDLDVLREFLELLKEASEVFKAFGEDNGSGGQVPPPNGDKGGD